MKNLDSKEKIEIELDSKVVKQLEIISKAFNKSMNWFIETNLQKDLDFILNYVTAGPGHLEEIEHYYDELLVNKKELKKLKEMI